MNMVTYEAVVIHLHIATKVPKTLSAA